MKEKNRIIAMLLAFTILLLLAACGKTASVIQQEAPTASEAEAEPAPEAAETADTPDAPRGASASSLPAGEAGVLLSSEPFVPEGLEKGVIGTDDRVYLIPDAYPDSCIAYLIATASCGCSWAGSGFMISRRGLVTASHCIYCEEHHQYIRDLVLYFGYRSSNDYYYKTSAWDYCWWGGSSIDGHYSADDDYGYILLSEPVGDTTGWFGWRVLSDQDLNNELFICAGYRDGELKSSGNYMEVLNEKLFKHYMDTEGGYSGGPVFDLDDYVVGINIAEQWEGGICTILPEDLPATLWRECKMPACGNG